jgi:hypothetical protein
VRATTHGVRGLRARAVRAMTCNVRARAVRATTRSVRARVVRQHAWCEGEGVEVLFGGREMQSSPAIFFLCIHIRAAVYQEPCDVKVVTSAPLSIKSRETSRCPCRNA